MQRLFSMFPRAAPGAALVLLRCSVAAALWIAAPAGSAETGRLWSAMSVVGCMCLLTGWLTSVVSGIWLVEQSVMLAAYGPGTFAICSILDAAALTVLGPGAYSVDAFLFGRRVVILTTGKTPRD